VEPSIGFEAVEVGQETVLADVLSDRFIRLNSSGTLIWRLLRERRSVGEISRQVSQELSLPPDQAFDVTAAFVKEMIGKGVATRSIQGNP
jgi:hypothetical protein